MIKSWDAGLGVFGTGIMISIANAEGAQETLITADWGVFLSGCATAFLMFVRACIIVHKHISSNRRENEKHNVEMKNKG